MPIFCSKCGKENRDTSKFCNNCVNPLQISTPSGPLHSGTILENRYKIINLIKAGGMGAVYKALDIKFDSICAIKELLPPYGATPQQEVQSAEWFKREAKLLNTLHHTNLPKVSDYFIHYNRYYLVMTFVEGEDLETILARDGNPELPTEKVVEWAIDVLQVLEYIHNQKPPIVYRDIKPGNIMIHKDGKAMLIDFGIARIVQESSQTKKTAIGTQGYAPPEQCRGQVEPRSDIYALGATMHHLLTGIEPLPFRFEPLRKINFKISTELENIVMKALKDKLHERFSSAKEMKEALVNLSIPLQIKAKPQPVIMPSQINQIVLPTKDLYKAPPIQKSYIEPETVDSNINFHYGKNNEKINWYEKGQKLQRENKYEEAIRCYDKAIEIDEHYYQAWDSKGECSEHLKKYGEAIKCYDKAKSLSEKPGSYLPSINEKDKHGNTLLHKAVKDGNLPEVKKLVNLGIDVNSINNIGETPLHLAVRNNFKDIVLILIENGANVNAKL